MLDFLFRTMVLDFIVGSVTECHTYLILKWSQRANSIQKFDLAVAVMT